MRDVEKRQWYSRMQTLKFVTVGLFAETILTNSNYRYSMMRVISSDLFSRISILIMPSAMLTVVRRK